MSGVGSSVISGVPRSFLSLPAAAVAGRKSATAAAMITTSAPADSAPIAACICAAVSTGTTRTPGGTASSTVDTRVTSAPRDTASAATAYPCLPDERLAMTRTASIGSRVPPALTTTFTPVEVARTEHVLHGGDDPLGRRQPARADVAAGEPSRLGLHDVHAPQAQPLEVLRHGRVLPHLRVHRRADDHRRPGGEQRGGQQIGRDPGRVGADEAGRGRRHQDQIGTLAEHGVRDRRLVVPEGGADRLGRQRRERGPPDEVLGALRHHGHDVRAGVDQATTDLDRLVGGDATGHAENDSLAGEAHHGWIRPGRRPLRRPRQLPAGPA